MDEITSSEEGEVEPIVRDAIETHLKDVAYDESKTQAWINSICEDTMKALAELEKPFKYIVNCVIMQNTGAGMHSAHSSFCDAVNDGVCIVKWPAEKNKDQNTMYCIVAVFGCALDFSGAV